MSFKQYGPLSFLFLLAPAGPAIAAALPATPRVTAPVHLEPVESRDEAPDAGTEFRFYVGPAMELGNRALLTSRTQILAGTSATPGTSPTNTASASATFTPGYVENGLGILYGVDATWWGGGRLGLGASLFGAYLGANQSISLMHLNGLDAGTYKNITATSGSATTTTTMTDATSISPPGVGVYSATIGIPAAGTTAPLTTTYAGFSNNGSFVMRQGDSAAANPKTTYASEGGVIYTLGRSSLINDFGLKGEYALVHSALGGVSFFGGVTIPVGTFHQTFTARTVGKGGQGDEASQTANVVGDAAAANTYTSTTKWKYNDTYTTDASFLMAGPVIGLDAHYQLGGIRLYSQVGYAPILTGSMTSRLTTATSAQTTVTIDAIKGTPGVTAGTTTNSTSISAPSEASSNVSGSEALAAIGAEVRLAGMRLFVEGTARNYLVTDQVLKNAYPEMVFGSKLGVALGF